MRKRRLELAYLFAIIFAVGSSSCQHGTPVSESGVSIVDPDKQLEPLLLNEVQLLESRTAEALYQVVSSSSESSSVTFEDANCGCTRLIVDGNPIQLGDRFNLAPGDSSIVKLTSRLSLLPNSYDFRAKLIARKSDGTQNELLIRLGVRVLADIVLAPDVFSHEFHSLDGEPITKTLRVERRWRGRIVPPSAPSLEHQPRQLAILEVTEEKTPSEIEPGIWSRSWIMKVSLSPSQDLLSDPVRSVVPITFRDSADSEPISADLPVLIGLAYGIEAPKLSYFGTLPVGEQQSRRILLRSTDEIDFSVIKTHSTSPAFSVAKYSVAKARSCWVELVYNPSEPGDHSSEIMIETDHPRNQKLVVRVRGKATYKAE